MKYILKLFPTNQEARFEFQKDLGETAHIERSNMRHTEIILTTNIVIMYRSIQSRHDLDRLRGIQYEGLYVYGDMKLTAEMKDVINAKITSYV